MCNGSVGSGRPGRDSSAFFASCLQQISLCLTKDRNFCHWNSTSCCKTGWYWRPSYPLPHVLNVKLPLLNTVSLSTNIPRCSTTWKNYPYLPFVMEAKGPLYSSKLFLSGTADLLWSHYTMLQGFFEIIKKVPVIGRWGLWTASRASLFLLLKWRILFMLPSWIF